MQTISKAEWDKLPQDYKGQWTETIWNYRQDFPKAWIGKRTMLGHAHEGTVLLTEGVHFKIQ